MPVLLKKNHDASIDAVLEASCRNRRNTIKNSRKRAFGVHRSGAVPKVGDLQSQRNRSSPVGAAIISGISRILTYGCGCNLDALAAAANLSLIKGEALRYSSATDKIRINYQNIRTCKSEVQSLVYNAVAPSWELSHVTLVTGHRSSR